MANESYNESAMTRRKFLRLSAATMGAVGSLGAAPAAELERAHSYHSAGVKTARAASRRGRRPYNGEYAGDYLNQVAFPLGGIGAGMLCLEGTGALSHVSLRNHPDVFNEPCVFAAISVKSQRTGARVLEGPVPARKLFGAAGTGNGAGGSTYGLPRFADATFKTHFPFGVVTLTDPQLPLGVEMTGWSPFEPGDADNSSLPVAALEYRFTNRSNAPVEAMFSFNAKNFMATGNNQQAVRPVGGGFILWGGGPKEKPWEEAAFSATVSEPGVKVNYGWFRGGWWDALTMAWKDVAEGACYDRAPLTEGDPSPGASLFVPIQLAAGASKTVALRLAWFSGQTNLRIGKDLAGFKPEAGQSPNYRPWYAGRFTDINGVTFYWRDHYDDLRKKARRFADCFYDSTLPAEVTEAVAANLTILKSPTVMRQTDGRLWSWEGCSDTGGCCHGSCTHVWNYAQAIPHLFPALERTLRETEFGPSQNEAGHQQFRSGLPIRPV